jgi:hypothetical protein
MYDVVSTRANGVRVSSEVLTRKFCRRQVSSSHHLTIQHHQEVEDMPEQYHTVDRSENGGIARVQRDVVKEGPQPSIAYENHPPHRPYGNPPPHRPYECDTYRHFWRTAIPVAELDSFKGKM